MLSNAKLLPSAIAAVATVAVAGVTFALASDSGADREPQTSSVQPTRQLAPDETPAPSELLAVFRRSSSQRSPEQTSEIKAKGAEVAEFLEQTGDAQPGENPADLRRADHPSGPVYLWPKKGGVCDSLGGCVPTAMLAQLGATVSIEYAQAADGSLKNVRANGLARDGIEQIRFQLAGGGETVVPVYDNVFVVDLGSARPLTATWHNPDGSVGIQRNLVPADGPL